MVSFIVPVGDGGPGFRFSVERLGVLFAGSRHGEVPQEVCQALIGGLARDGFSFWVGCASGVNRCFRKALSLRVPQGIEESINKPVVLPVQSRWQ